MKSIASLAYAAITLVVACVQSMLKKSKQVFPKPLLLLILLLGFVILAIAILSPWSKTILISSTAFLLLAVLLFSSGFELPKKRFLAESIFYVCVSSVLVFEVLANIGVTGAMYINDAYDKNYLGIILFLYFAWCWYTSRRIGIVIAVSSAALIGSRNYIIMILLFFILWFIQEHFIARDTLFPRAATKKLGSKQVFGIFILMFLAIIFFSFWWSDNMVGTNTTSYGVSMNDSSNAIRFNSDKYAIQHIMDNSELLLYGYDNDIIEAMNVIQVSSLNGTETAFDGTFYNGYRIVQPHNVILNMFLKEGVLYTLLYFAILSYVFAPYFRKDNIACWMPYLFGCMFMHSLLINYYLIFFLLVLARSDSGLGFVTPSFCTKWVRCISTAVTASHSFSQKNSCG